MDQAGLTCTYLCLPSAESRGVCNHTQNKISLFLEDEFVLLRFVCMCLEGLEGVLDHLKMELQVTWALSLNSILRAASALSQSDLQPCRSFTNENMMVLLSMLPPLSLHLPVTVTWPSCC